MRTTLASPQRSAHNNTLLAYVLTFVAGAVNAGGFLAVGHYTSHMSGMLASAADHIVLGNMTMVVVGLASLLAFMAGSALCAVLVNWGRRLKLHSVYATPLLAEAALIVLFGLLGAALSLQVAVVVPLTVLLLCTIMGLQNALITKVSNATIRTTHVTGMVTDLGIELGKLLYWNRHGADPNAPKVLADRPKMRLLAALIGLFFGGGVLGAVGFQHVGYVFTLPFAGVLLWLAYPYVSLDVQQMRTGRSN